MGEDTRPWCYTPAGDAVDEVFGPFSTHKEAIADAIETGRGGPTIWIGRCEYVLPENHITDSMIYRFMDYLCDVDRVFIEHPAARVELKAFLCSWMLAYAPRGDWNMSQEPNGFEVVNLPRQSERICL